VSTFVAFLRAVNLGTQRRVAMGQLRTALTDAGYRDVATHLQSGNVVLSSRASRPDSVARSVEKVLAAEFDLDVDVMVRTTSELAKITRTNPFLRAGSRADPASLHVAFLKARPSAAAARAISGHDFGRDEFVVRGSELYLKYPNGVARSKMNTGFFERALGTRATVRTWKVVMRLRELARS